MSKLAHLATGQDTPAALKAGTLRFLEPLWRSLLRKLRVRPLRRGELERAYVTIRDGCRICVRPVDSRRTETTF